jgi:uncharacterized protein YxjI
VALLPMVAVVGPQFCAPDTMALTVTKKAFSWSGGDFNVSDVYGAVLMKVQGRYLSRHSHRVLCDAAGTPIISMRKKLISWHDTWKVYRGDSSDKKDLLFTAKRSHMMQLKTNLDVFLSGNDRICDFKVKGSWFERSCTFYLGDTNTIIAHMSREYSLKNVLLRKDTFGITVYPGVDYALIVSIIVILYEIQKPDS